MRAVRRVTSVKCTDNPYISRVARSWSTAYLMQLRSHRPVDTRHLGQYILSMRLFHNNRNTLLHTLYTLSLYLSDTH